MYRVTLEEIHLPRCAPSRQRVRVEVVVDQAPAEQRDSDLRTRHA